MDGSPITESGRLVLSRTVILPTGLTMTLGCAGPLRPEPPPADPDIFFGDMPQDMRRADDTAAPPRR